jgi:pyruvate/2-oxoglutarate dehydrogenase complex dihydrolipoamide acyltransferase (E2) component
MLASASRTTWAAFKSAPTSALAASTALAATVRTAATAAAIPAASAEGPLESGSGIASADAGGLAREIAERIRGSVGIGYPCARFTRK